MDWIILAVVSTLFFTGANFTDKFQIGRFFTDLRILTLHGALVAALVSTGLWVLNDFQLLPWADAALVLVVGMSVVGVASLYFRAISQAEASTMIILLQAQPVFVLLLSMLILGEVITTEQFIGFTLIMVASLGLSARQAGIQLGNAFWPVMGINLMVSLQTIALKFVLDRHPVTHMMIAEGWGFGLGAMLWLALRPRLRHIFWASWHTLPREAIFRNLMKEAIFVTGGKVTVFAAIALGPVALVKAIGSTQVFVGILVGWLLTSLVPQWVQESISGPILARKMAFASLMFVGVLMLD